MTLENAAMKASIYSLNAHTHKQSVLLLWMFCLWLVAILNSHGAENRKSTNTHLERNKQGWIWPMANQIEYFQLFGHLSVVAGAALGIVLTAQPANRLNCNRMRNISLLHRVNIPDLCTLWVWAHTWNSNQHIHV